MRNFEEMDQVERAHAVASIITHGISEEALNILKAETRYGQPALNLCNADGSPRALPADYLQLEATYRAGMHYVIAFIEQMRNLNV